MGASMSKATQGQQYTVQTGDTLPSVASQAYGDPAKQELIRDVNQTNIIFTDVEDLAPGQKLLIPFDNENQALRQAQLQRGLT